MKLLKADTVEGAIRKMDSFFGGMELPSEKVHITECLGRILSEDVFSASDLPEFDRATVDGYAVMAKDTFGASESLPTFLDIAGMVHMGKPASIKLSPGQAVYVPTGGMMPEGSDAMVMLEYTEKLDDSTVIINASVAPGGGIIRKGEDATEGALLFGRGRLLRPQDVGALAGLGIESVSVFRRLRISIISTGDEIVDPFENVDFGQIRDINTYAISAMAAERGADVVYSSVLKDDFGLLQSTARSLMEKSDIVVISGGSSVGAKDVTSDVIDSLGEPGVFVHGIAIKPGKPTIMGKVGQTAVFGLPGHPVSAIMIYKVFVERLMDMLTSSDSQVRFDVTAVSDANIHTAPGKDTYQMVSLYETDGEYVFSPIYGKAGSITLLTRAHGYIAIPGNREGVLKGDRMKVRLI